MVELILTRAQTGFNIAEAFPKGELTKGHAQKLIPAGEGFYFVVSVVASHTPTKLLWMDQISELGEDKFSGMHPETLDTLEIIRLYGWCFKIEVSFKQAIHTVGAYAYHFWMQDMTPIRRGSGKQYVQRKSEIYRAHVRRKLAAYERHIQLGLIAQGLLQY